MYRTLQTITESYKLPAFLDSLFGAPTGGLDDSSNGFSFRNCFTWLRQLGSTSQPRPFNKWEPLYSNRKVYQIHPESKMILTYNGFLHKQLLCFCLTLLEARQKPQTRVTSFRMPKTFKFQSLNMRKSRTSTTEEQIPYCRKMNTPSLIRSKKAP